jgi:protein-tyrosine kinase
LTTFGNISTRLSNNARQALTVANGPSGASGAVTAAASVFDGFPKEKSTSPLDDAALKKPKHTQNEIVRLVQRLFVMPWSGRRIRSVMISAVGNGSATEKITACVAETLAAQDLGTVCLVDANVHAPTLHRCFSIPNRRGFTEFFCDPTKSPKDLAYQVGESVLWVMAAGVNCDSRPAMTAEHLAARLSDLLHEFDYVLINAPVTNAQVSDFLLATFTDGVVLVVEADETRREVALKAKQDFEVARARLLGVVLNNRKYPIPEMIYSRL